MKRNLSLFPRKAATIIALFLCLVKLSYGQSISGTTCIPPSGGTYNYILSGISSSFTEVWTVTGGHFVAGSTGVGLTSVYVSWNSGITTGTLNVVIQGMGTNYTLYAHPWTTISPGTIANPTQNIPVNTTPSTLACSSASGGCTLGFSYLWFKSTDNINFVSTGTTAQNLSISVPLTQRTYYKRLATDNINSGLTAFTNTAVVNIISAVNPGAVTPTSQTINYSTAPATLTVNGVSGGNGTYSYQWQSSTDPNFTSVSNVGTNSPTYNPPPLTALITYYRVAVTSNGETAYSAYAAVNVYGQVSGTISPVTQIILYNDPPGILSLSADGGNHNYSYQWQSSPDNSAWSNIGTNAPTYTPTGLSVNTVTYYRTIVSSNGASNNSNTVSVTFASRLLPGAITPAGVTTASGTSPGTLFGSPAGGGLCASLTYQWQSGSDGINFSNIGVGTPNYTPGPITSNTYFRRMVSCGSQTVYTNVVKVSVSTTATTDNMNLIRQREILRPGIADVASAQSLTNPVDVHQTTQYFDGLGRPSQTVVWQTTPAGKDLVIPVEYDAWGREVTHYLPYVSPSQDGFFKNNALLEHSVFNNVQFPGEQQYYEQDSLELSPLNRLLTKYSPGQSWIGSSKGISVQYLFNSTSDSVQVWKIAAAVRSLPVSSGSYAANQLYKNVTLDEAKRQVVEYKDKEGHVILKKTQFWDVPATGHSGWFNTYYVYDDLNNLRFVVQPKAVEWLIANSWNFANTGGSQVADELCFRYEYDGQGRVIIKKTPGAGETLMVYDVRDRLVMTQDSVLRSLQKWQVTCYDGLNRPDTIALITDPSHYNDLSWHITQAASASFYPPTTGYTTELETQFYYDSYDWVTAIGGVLSATMNTTYNTNSTYFYTSYNVSPNYALPINQILTVRGQPTGYRSRIIDTTQFVYSVPFYDDHGRIIGTQSTNYTNGLDQEWTQYDFSGNPLRKLLSHKKNGINPQGHLVLTKYSYDPTRRQTSIVKNMDGVEQRIDTLIYDELGQLKTKTLGNNLESLNYNYNVRGWMTAINRQYLTGSAQNYFGMELGYDNSASGITTYKTPQFSGNISGMVWKSAGAGISRKYDFSYDNVGRLTAAEFTQYNGSTFAPSATIDFSVPNIAYDANGNILSMIQRGYKIGGSAAIDRLRYNYFPNTNRLQQVYDTANDAGTLLSDFHFDPATKDPSTDYAYDANGNLIADKNKGIRSVRYNFLNLVQQVSAVKANGSSRGNIIYKYDAMGIKWAKITTDSTASPIRKTTTLYIKGFEYSNDTIQFVSHEEGKTRYLYQHYMNGDSSFRMRFDYFIKDHLGNIRVVLTDQRDTTQYVATMENAYRTKENSLFYNIPQTSYARSAASGYPVDYTTTNPNDSIIRLSGSGQKVGPAIILKVMSGDTVKIGANYYFNTSAAGNGQTLSSQDLITSLASGIVSLTGGSHGSLGDLTGASTPLTGALTSFITDKNGTTSGKPNAYLNWILLDNQFGYVNTGGQSGAAQVATAGTTAGGTLQTPLGTTINVKTSGYLYIYVSNATPNWDVFFDNLTVMHYAGPMMEEDHYYPFGLTMAGVSDKALKGKNYTENKYRYNGKELQSKEFSDNTGLEWTDFGQRMYDQQIGRWHVQDRFSEKYYSFNPYNYAINNPVNIIDIRGDTIELIIGKPYKDANGEDHPYGHVALRVFNAAEGYDNVYDFGRYGETWGFLSSKGEGILNVYSDGKNYKESEMSDRSSVGYTKATTIDQDKTVMGFFEKKIKEGTPTGKPVPGPDGGAGKGKQYKLKTDYSAMDNNCCTISKDALALIGISWFDTYKPNDAYGKMERQYQALDLTRTEYNKGGQVTVTYQATGRSASLQLRTYDPVIPPQKKLTDAFRTRTPETPIIKH